MAYTNSVFVLGKDINGNVTYKRPFTPVGSFFTLSAGVAKSVTVPQNVDSALITNSTGTDVWVCPDTTATLPSGTVTTTSSELNANLMEVTPGQTLSFICGTAAAVKVSFFKINNTL